MVVTSKALDSVMIIIKIMDSCVKICVRLMCLHPDAFDKCEFWSPPSRPYCIWRFVVWCVCCSARYGQWHMKVCGMMCVLQCSLWPVVYEGLWYDLYVAVLAMASGIWRFVVWSVCCSARYGQWHVKVCGMICMLQCSLWPVVYEGLWYDLYVAVLAMASGIWRFVVWCVCCSARYGQWHMKVCGMICVLQCSLWPVAQGARSNEC